MAASLKPKPGFDWGKVVWSPADGRIAPLCSYCLGPIDEDDVPLMLWKPGGACCQFCDDCQVKWWGLER